MTGAAATRQWSHVLNKGTLMPRLVRGKASGVQNEAMSAIVGRNGRAERVIALLEDSVRTELQVTNGGFGLGLSDQSIERLMEGVTSGLLYAFAVDWSPDWVRPGEVHHWEESGRFFARCGVCLADSPASPDEQTAATWAHSHEDSH